MGMGIFPYLAIWADSISQLSRGLESSNIVSAAVYIPVLMTVRSGISGTVL